MSYRWAPDHSFWHHRSVGVTGATGFVGSHVVDQLVDCGADVVVLVRDSIPPTSILRRWSGQVVEVRGAVEDRAVMVRLLGEYGVRTVFHLAAQSQVGVANQDPLSTFEANVTGTWSVLDACRCCPTVEQVVLASSDKAYGEQAVLPYTENMPLNALNPYDVSKACSDLLSRSYAHTFGVPVTITRCGNIFGPGDTNWNRLVPGVMRDVLRGYRPVIRSDGQATRDYLYVVDAALTYLRLAEAIAGQPELAGEAFNFSTERPLSVLGLVEHIQGAVGSQLEPVIQDIAEHEIADQWLSTAKARRLLGWEPQFTLEDALADTVAWYRQALGFRPAS